MGLRKHEGQGCILADEMYVPPAVQFSGHSDEKYFRTCRGMGKTLQVRFHVLIYPYTLVYSARSRQLRSVGLCLVGIFVEMSRSHR